MSHKTTRKGGRSWWGKIEAKLASKVTRRRDDLDAIVEQAREDYRPVLDALDAYDRGEKPRLVGTRWWLWDTERECFHDQRCLEAWEMVTEGCSNEDLRFFNCRHDVWMDPDYAREQAETESW